MAAPQAREKLSEKILPEETTDAGAFPISNPSRPKEEGGTEKHGPDDYGQEEHARRPPTLSYEASSGRN
jgi:hypothetical protein